MGIGSIGFSELAVIFIIVLVFFGPRRFPEIARSMGHAMREFRRSLNQIQRELEDADPRSSIPGRDLLNDIRSGRTGKWLDPKRADAARKSAGPPSAAPGPSGTPLDASSPPRTGPQETGEAAGRPSDAGEQLPMFGREDAPPAPGSEAPATDAGRGTAGAPEGEGDAAREPTGPDRPTDRPAD